LIFALTARAPRSRLIHSLVRPAPRAFFRPDRLGLLAARAQGLSRLAAFFAATRRAWPWLAWARRHPRSDRGRRRRYMAGKFKPVA